MLVAIIIWQEISQFISSILNSKFIITILTSWPLAVVIIVMLLRKGILDKLKQLDSFNYKDGTAKFIRDTLNQVKTNQTLSNDEDSNQLENDYDEDFETDLLSFKPHIAVQLHWKKLEDVIDEAYVKLSGNDHIERSKRNKKIYPSEKIKFLQNKEFININTANSLHGLRKIRNEVAHGVPIDKESTIEFAKLCNEMIFRLKNKLKKAT
ncbi:hypothetical protein CS953_10180 [Bacillus safensis]|uniref:hypothetical protein n=1 Tax=Bacillus safensis TaxID=561879 RepID=UPI000EF2D7B7|nr:hypothetical protein [Bacillus safensis]AYJ90063.1 hypothetical protein CS953_10180 [Bacillus safensis]